MTVEFEDRASIQRLPKDAVLLYLMNHRSNADYVLVGYALSGQVAISYAVGEWARAFPLEHLFKAFGAYFVRRRYRERLYHTVLERYVQLITRRGVTQGIFSSGGLTRDGKLARRNRIARLRHRYRAGTRISVAHARDPVAVNYDRVLGIARCCWSSRRAKGGRVLAPGGQMDSVTRFILWNVARPGDASVETVRPGGCAVWETSGSPTVVRARADALRLPRPERLAKVPQLSDDVMNRIVRLIPVTPVALACAAIQIWTPISFRALACWSAWGKCATRWWN